MTGSTVITPAASQSLQPADPYLVEVVAPIESATRDATIAAIRGPVPAGRNTLAGLSDALDAEVNDVKILAARVARRYALIFG